MHRKGSSSGNELVLERILPRTVTAKQTQKIAAALLEGSSPSARPLYWKGVHGGRFFRVKLEHIKSPPKEPPNPSHLPALPTPGGTVPHGFKSVNPKKPKGTSKETSSQQDAKTSLLSFPSFSEYFGWENIHAWWKENWSTVVLNFGSVCTLIGFTRSDVLELRCLSVTGSLANVVYNLTFSPTRYLPICWSGLFAAVNGFKIREIIQERHQQVLMTPEQEDIFVQFFMPHGITPRQFQVLFETAEQVVVPKGEAIIRQGEVIDHVGLVVSGSTRASISGRRLTAASAICPKSITEEKAGGNSGAWIGEMSFLENYWQKEQQKTNASAARKTAVSPALEKNGEKGAKDSEEKSLASNSVKEIQSAAAKSVDGDEKNESQKNIQQASSISKNDEKTTCDPPTRNRYTIVAASDCVIWRWNFDQVETLMNRSTDFRAALSRAMTSAIVSKVVNFTISKTSTLPTWSTWLDDWRCNAGARVHVKTDVDDDEPVEPETDDEDESAFEEHGVI